VGSLGLLGNNVGGILFAAAVVTGLALWLYRRDRAMENEAVENTASSLGAWLSANRWQVLLTEVIFAILFVLWVWVRSQNPAIAATEKPMEIAFLNAIGRSPVFPPLDPWLSGFAISYYYFGYVMTSLIARLAMVPEAIAFNLGIAWLVAGAGTGAFGLVFNLLRSQGARRSAWILGLVAALALPLAGNMTIGLEIAHANGIGSPAFWEWMDVRDLDTPATDETPRRYEGSNWWWWRSSRPLREYHLSGQVEEGLEPIVENPSFSFILGDLHAHVLALPYAFLALAAAMAWWLPGKPVTTKNNESSGEEGNRSWLEDVMGSIRLVGHPLWIFTAVILGGLVFLNTWDVLIHLFVVLGAFALGRWREEGWSMRIITQTVVASILLVAAVALLYLPFFLGFRSQAGAPYLLPMMMRPTRLAQFLIIFGMPLWAITILLIALVVRQRFRYWPSGIIVPAVLIAVLLIAAFFFSFVVAASPEGSGRVLQMATDLGVSLPERLQEGFAPGWALATAGAIAPAYFAARLGSPWMTLLLASFIGMAVMVWQEVLNKTAAADNNEEMRKNAGDVLPFALLLIVTGALLTLGPEFVFLRDNFGARMNTIFKFYYQAWVLFGCASLFAIGYLWLEWQGNERIVPVIATAGYALMFIVAMSFPVFAVNSRGLEYRGPATAESRKPATLDGLAQMNRYNPGDYEAVVWLRENVEGTPVILEAVGGQYSNFGRISAGTGLPTVLGWAGHEYQWRGNTPEPAIREPIVQEIYSSLDINSAGGLLDEYDVRYIVVGGLERETYGLDGLEKFAEALPVAFESNGTTIYRWQPQ
jgi:YYY domain-containing protein